MLHEGNERIESSPKTVIDEYLKLLEQSSANNNTSNEKLAATHYILSKAYYAKILANKASFHAQTALDLLQDEQYTDSLLYNKVLVLVAYANEMLGHVKKARPMAEQALEWAELNKNNVLKQDAIVVLGLCDLSSGAFDAALLRFNQAYYMNNLDPQMMAKGHIAYYIALVHEYSNNHSEAIRFYEQAKAYYKQNNRILSYSDALYGLASAYKFIDEHEKALVLFEESLKISKEYNDTQGQGYTYKELATIYLNQKQFKKAHLNMIKALQLFSESKNPFMLAIVHHELADFALMQGQIPQAHKLADIALTYAEGESLRPHFIRLTKFKSKLLAKNGNFKEAYETLLISYEEQINFNSVHNNELYERMRAEFNLNEKEDQNRELEMLNNRAHLSLEAQERQKMILIFLSGLCFAIALGAIAMYKKSRKAQSQLAKLANTDPLTQLANRRTAFISLASQIKLAKRESYDLSIALVDLDHFKMINDKLGHPAGDKVLRIFAKLAQSQFRSSDVIARIGGEEFLFIFPFTDVAQAQSLIIDFTEEIKNLEELNTLIGRPLTCSVGIVNANDFADELSAISAADKAMYKAKNSGRDAIVID